MSAAELTTYTANDLLNLSDGNGYELVDGQLVKKDMGAHSSWIGGNLYAMLHSYADKGMKGWAFPADAGIQCFPDDPEKSVGPTPFSSAAGAFPTNRFQKVS